MSNPWLVAGPGEPTAFENRPPIDEFIYMSPEGNQLNMRVGIMGVTEIRETGENSEYCLVPWLEVWAGDSLIARFNQHKVERIWYRRSA